VAASRVTEPDDVAPALAKALASGAPYLLDVVIEGRR
jgi:thiamine pyrophosphate-dependent acetolactate synthase large subunit-like protein